METFNFSQTWTQFIEKKQFLTFLLTSIILNIIHENFGIFILLKNMMKVSRFTLYFFQTCHQLFLLTFFFIDIFYISFLTDSFITNIRRLTKFMKKLFILHPVFGNFLY